MTTAHHPHAPAAEEPQTTEIDVADDLVPVVAVVFQAGPPAYVIVAFGAAIALLVCGPLMILAAILIISLVVTTTLAGLAAALVLVPLHLVRSLDVRLTHRAGPARHVASPRVEARRSHTSWGLGDLLRPGVARAFMRTRASAGAVTSHRRTR